MNVHEFRVFAREAFRHNAADVAVDKITTQWEADVEAAGARAIEEYEDNKAMAHFEDDSMLACNGPCCS